MSIIVDFPLVVLQKAQHAAEAAVASAKLLESEAGHRLTSIEARLVGVEGRLSLLSAGQSANTVSLIQIADTQSEHTARFEGVDTRLQGIDARLEGTDTRLEGIDKRLNGIDARLEGIEHMLASILAKPP